MRVYTPSVTMFPPNDNQRLSKARALHLVGEDDTIPMTSLKGYRRPSVIR
jgi:hypothetical protein